MQDKFIDHALILAHIKTTLDPSSPTVDRKVSIILGTLSWEQAY